MSQGKQPAPPEAGADVEVAVIGASTPSALRARLPLVAARARAAERAGKRLGDFVRESGREWMHASCRVAIVAASFAELEARMLAACALITDDARGPVDAPGIHFGVVEVPAASAASPLEAPRPPLPADLAGLDVDAAVAAIFKRLTGYDDDAFDAQSDLADDLGVDSLKHAQIVETVWAHHGIPLDPALTIADMPCLARMIAYVRENLPADRPAAPAEVAAPAASPWLSEATDDGGARLTAEALERALAVQPRLPRAWLPADDLVTYGRLDPAGQRRLLALHVTGREVVARRTGVAPARIRLRPSGPDEAVAYTATAPLTAHPLSVAADNGALVVRPSGPCRLDLAPVLAFYQRHVGAVDTAVAQVTAAIMHKFLEAVRVDDPEGLEAAFGQPLVYLSNHQTAIDTFIFPRLAFALGGTLPEGVAMLDHGVVAADAMRGLFASYDEGPQPQTDYVVDTTNPANVLAVLPRIERDLLGGGRSLCIAAGGGRERRAGQPIGNLSAVWIDLALRVGCPIVPVRFMGGLPMEDPGDWHDLPVGYAKQTVVVGRLITPEALAAVPPAARPGLVLRALEETGPASSDAPAAADDAFGRAVETWAARAGVPALVAALFCTLERFCPLPALALKAGHHEVASPLEALVAAGRLWRALSGEVALRLPADADGRWLAGIAALAFGAGGPRVYVHPDEVPAGVATTVRVRP